MSTIITSDEAIPSVSAAYLAESNTTKILTTVGVWCFLAFITVALRLFVRARILRYVGPDDIMMGITMLLGLILFTCFVGEAKNGLGRHYEWTGTGSVTTYRHWTFIHSLVSLLGLTAVKISVSLLLLRIATQRIYRIFLWILIVFLISYTLMCVFTLIFACLPVSASWDYTKLETAKCFSNTTFTALGITNSVCNMLGDTILAILPIPMIMNLQLNVRAKVALAMILALGFVAVACGAVKTHYQLTVQADRDARFKNNFFIWAAMELYTGIVASSLPTLKPLLSKFLEAARSSAGLSGAGRTSDYTRNNTAYRSNLSNGGFKKQPLVSSIPLEDMPTAASSPTKHPDDIESFFGVTTTATHKGPGAATLTRESYEESIQDGSSQNSNEGDGLGIIRTTKVVTMTESRSVPRVNDSQKSPIKPMKTIVATGDNSSVHELLDNNKPEK
ncbi:hypothetical protein MBLNU459_g3385t1 [Dothideomycetes sp. NU459]